MKTCAYIGAEVPKADKRIAELERHHFPVHPVTAIGDIPPDTALAIVDGSAGKTEETASKIKELTASGLIVFAIFKLAHGETFRSCRETLLNAGAGDVMDVDAPDGDLVIRTRALMRGARPPFVLVVEDNEKTGPWVVNELQAAGMEAQCVTTLAEARERFETMTIDAMVVDRNLPDGDGLDFVGLLRRNGFRTPALLFTALDSISDRIKGLTEAGADDYICKPVHGDELVARVQVLLRPRDIDETVIFGPLELVRRDKIVRWRGDRVELRPKECGMLIYLAEREGLMIPKRMIYADVWEKVYMDFGSNPVTAARHRLVKDFKTWLEARGENWIEFLVTEGEAYGFRAEPLLQLPGREQGA